MIKEVIIKYYFKDCIEIIDMLGFFLFLKSGKLFLIN